MIRFSQLIPLGFAIMGLAACGAATQPAGAPAGAANSVAPHANLSRIVELYWRERTIPGNALSPQHLADTLALERRYLAALLAVPRAGLDDADRLTYDMFKRQRESDIELFTYPGELLPVNPFEGPPQDLVRAAAEARQRPSSSQAYYENWLARIDAYDLWTQQAIVNMRDGERRGYTAPRVLMQRLLPWLQALGEDTAANVLYAPWRTLPQSIAEPARTRIASQLDAAVRTKLLPDFRHLHDFIQREYLPRARATLALSALPLGASWYAALVRRATDSPMTPREIHAIGVADVERLHARLQALGATPATPPASTQPAAGDLLHAYEDLKAQTLAAMPSLFAAAPPADLEIRAAGAWSDAMPLLEYRAAPPPGLAGAILYVHTAADPVRPDAVDVAAFLREAIPGRHLQAAVQRARADLPSFRRFGSDPAFVDGWALYASSLGDELGLYRDDAARRQAVLGDLDCAAALVVDTGLQADDWTREQAVDYLRAQLGLDDAAAAAMTDRFLAFPAAALACKMGEQAIQALRARAQQTLGERFDIREFHAEILKDGAMPLDLLREKMQLWMEAGR